MTNVVDIICKLLGEEAAEKQSKKDECFHEDGWVGRRGISGESGGRGGERSKVHPAERKMGMLPLLSPSSSFPLCDE